MFAKTMKNLCWLSLAVSLLTSSGCGPFWVNPYVTVEETPLNWVEIHYYNLSRKPIRRTSVYMTGGGHVELRKGTSELISNDFAKNYALDSWQNIRTQRLTIDPGHVRDVFQNLVNHGLLDKEKTFKSSKKTKFERFVAVKANVSNTTYSEKVNIFEADPDLAEQLMDVIREFDNPALR